MTGVFDDALGLIGLLAIGLAIYWFALTAYSAWALTHPKRRTYASAVARNQPGDPGELDKPIAFEDRTIELYRDEVRCWIIEGRDASGPTVVMSPGWSDSRIGALSRLSPVLERASRIVALDPPGHGDTPGTTDLGAQQASLLVATLGAVAPEGPIVVFGWSLGAGVSIEAAALREDDPERARGVQQRIVGVIAEAPYRLVHTPAARVMKMRSFPTVTNLRPALALVGFAHGAGPGWRRFDRGAWAQKLSCPLLVIHGVNDPVSPIEDGRAIANAASDGRIVEIEGGGHNDLWTDERFRGQAVSAVEAFLASIARTPDAPTIS